ncbi:hypothetical protein [Cellulomonas massiliensis]|uniref:hypothetical protein n=1 Tax=Cellulomonas massiliensis TaxID=1465811 RepID=UPI00030FD4F7|nr:hypothetical protein [Cellulomonas massiliensis]
MRLAASLALGAGLVVGAVAPAHAADDDLVTLGGTTSATLPAVEVASARFPVVPTDPKAVLTPEVVSITSDGFEVVAPSAVTARYDDSTPALVLEVRTDELPDVATYAVTVRLTAGGGQRQSVTVSLVRPAATLTVPATTTWTRTTPLCLGSACLVDIPWLGTPADQPPLVVSTGTDSRVLDLRARPAQGDAPRLEVGAPKAGTLPLGPDEDVTLPYSAGPAAPGSVERTAALVSDQVGTATPVTVTVVTRRPNSLIGLILVGGVLLGWLVRSVLPLAARRAERLRARQAVDGWLADTEAAYDDRAVHEAVAAARRTLDRQTDAAALATAEASVRSALTAFETRLAELSASANALEVAARHRRGLESLDAQLTTVRAQVAAARAAIAGLRGDEATSAVRDATAALRRLVEGAGEASAAPLADLADALTGRTEGAQGELARVVATLQSAVPAAPAADATVEQLGTYLDGLSLASRFRAVDAAVRQVAAEAASAARALGQRTPPVPAPDVESSAQALRTAVDRGEGASTAPVLRRLQEAYDAAAAPLGAEVAARVARGDVAALASQHLGAGGDDAAGPVEVDLSGETSQVTTVGPPVLTPRTLSLPAAAALAQLGAVGLHTLVAVVLVLVTGYALFLPDWLGTNAQLGQVAVWAFAVDTSIAGLALLAAQRTGPTAAGPTGAPTTPVATPGATTTTTVTTEQPQPAGDEAAAAQPPAAPAPAPPAPGPAPVVQPVDEPVGEPVDEAVDEPGEDHADEAGPVLAAGGDGAPDAGADVADGEPAVPVDLAAGNGNPQGGAAHGAGPQGRA